MTKKDYVEIEVLSGKRFLLENNWEKVYNLSEKRVGILSSCLQSFHSSHLRSIDTAHSSSGHSAIMIHFLTRNSMSIAICLSLLHSLTLISKSLTSQW